MDDLAVGGMSSKIQAAKIVVRAGIPLVIASGRKQDALAKILSGADVADDNGWPPSCLLRRSGASSAWREASPRETPKAGCPATMSQDTRPLSLSGRA